MAIIHLAVGEPPGCAEFHSSGSQSDQFRMRRELCEAVFEGR